MKIGVSSYSFGRLVKAGEITQLDVIREAKEMGFSVIEFSTFVLPEGETPQSFAPKVKEECEKHGLEIACYTIGADFLNGSDGDLEKEVDRVKEDVRVAQMLGVPCMRHDGSRGYPPERKAPRGFDDALPTLAKGCRAVTEFAADLGVKTTVENHGYFCQDSVRVEKLINAVGHENFGVLIDIGNFICVDEDPATAVGRLAPYAFHVHAKDFHRKPGASWNPGEGWAQSRGGNRWRGSIIGHGDVPILQCLRVLKKADYDGVCSIEFEGMEEPRKGIRIGLDNLKRMMAALDQAS